MEARRSRHLRARLQLAHLPFVKTFEQFDFHFQHSINEWQIWRLCSLRFIHEASKVILLGPPGVGKTHLSVALAEETIRSSLGAYFITAPDLATDLGRAYREGWLDRRMRVYLAPKVLVIDEVGYSPLDELGTTIFFQLVSARYERGSIILTSNKSYGAGARSSETRSLPRRSWTGPVCSGAGPASWRALFPPTGLPPGTPSPGAFPEEHPSRRPPSTSSPCPAWFCRLPRPLMGRSQTAVQERFAPLQLLALVQFCEERAPDVQPHLLLLPISQPPPAGRGRRVFVRQVLPASAAAQHPQDSFQHVAVVGTRSPAARILAGSRQQRRDFFPL
ncbi:MAG: ATP-binding protein [Acidobacteria bacterium]|nr:ATP-binding protein [Acidobacteriota bacterium]